MYIHSLKPICIYILVLQTIFFNFVYLNAKTRIVCTAALIKEDYEARKTQYINGLTMLQKYGYETYVFESCAKGPTFLDKLCNKVYYTQTNNPKYKNKGINEALSLLVGFKKFNFDSEDMIIKFTGRYMLQTDEFLKLVDQSNIDADVFVRTWNETNAYTALFAMRMKYFLDFLNTCIDSEVMESDWIGIEQRFGEYITKIKKQGVKVVHLKQVYSYLPIATPDRRR